ncbi:antitoxin VapB family protein [Candidatus Woesearchaeota archaeon]|nr:antitoxin VapB family protein [Candidatus Woesearchaeota archaeon]
MATKTITITEEAYGLLASRKDTEDSFSDAIKKHFKKESLLSLVGTLTSQEAKELRIHVAERRNASRQRIKHH